MNFCSLTLYAFLPAILWFCSTGHLEAQSSAGEHASVESRTIVTMPTAGVISKGAYAINAYIFSQDGVMAEWAVAPFSNVNMSISFGGTGVIGQRSATWQKYPGLHVRVRPLDESLRFPAVLLGVSTQGRGRYDAASGQFLIVSPGLYIALSKSYTFLGTMAIHGGLNYSLEPAPDNRAVNVYAGIEKSLGSPFSFLVEYNATLYKDIPFQQKKGLLNCAMRCSVGKGLTLEIQAQDLLQHFREATTFTRLVGIEYIGRF